MMKLYHRHAVPTSLTILITTHSSIPRINAFDYTHTRSNTHNPRRLNLRRWSLVLPPLLLYTALLLSLKLLISLLKLIPSLALPLQLPITTTATSRLLLRTPILLPLLLLLPVLLLVLTLLDPKIDFIKIKPEENGTTYMNSPCCRVHQLRQDLLLSVGCLIHPAELTDKTWREALRHSQ